MSPPEDVSSLLNNHGFMLGKRGFRKALSAGDIDMKQVWSSLSVLWCVIGGNNPENSRKSRSSDTNLRSTTQYAQGSPKLRNLICAEYRSDQRTTDETSKASR